MGLEANWRTELSIVSKKFVFVKHTKTQSGNQTLKTLLPKKHWTHHDHLKFYCFFSSSPSHRAKIEGQGEQDRGGDSRKGKNWLVRGGGKDG